MLGDYIFGELSCTTLDMEHFGDPEMVFDANIDPSVARTGRTGELGIMGGTLPAQQSGCKGNPEGVRYAALDVFCPISGHINGGTRQEWKPSWLI